MVNRSIAALHVPRDEKELSGAPAAVRPRTFRARSRYWFRRERRIDGYFEAVCRESGLRKSKRADREYESDYLD